MSIRTLIRQKRRLLGLSEQQFADAVGVSRGAVQQWEKPDGTAPKRANQSKVAELPGISVAELVSGDSFPEGSILVVEPQLTAEPGDYVIALNSKNQTTFKQLVKDGADDDRKPLNTRYPVKPRGNAEIIGEMREFTKRFRQRGVGPADPGGPASGSP